MTNQFAAGLAARLHRLADQLVELRERVREVIAAEAGRPVGEAVRDLIVVAIRGRIPVPTTAPFPAAGYRHRLRSRHPRSRCGTPCWPARRPPGGGPPGPAVPGPGRGSGC